MKVKKFKQALLIGSHSEREWRDGKPLDVMYNATPGKEVIILSTQDLAKMHNQPGSPKKFDPQGEVEVDLPESQVDPKLLNTDAPKHQGPLPAPTQATEMNKPKGK